MAVLLPAQPLWVQDKGYSARDDRALFTIIGPGIVQGLTVTAGPGMAVTVAPGVAVIPGTRNTGQGSYAQRIDTSVVVPWPTAGASPRVDTLYMQVLDNSEIFAAGGSPVSNEGCVLDVAQGTTTVPADALAIASVTVPASASSIVAGNVAGVIKRLPTIPVDIGLATTLPTGVPDGYEVVMYPTSSKVWHLRKIGGSWFFVGGAPLYAFSQPLASATTTWTLQAPTVAIPRPGLYQVDWGFQAISNTPDTATYVLSTVMGPGSPAAGSEPVLQAPCVYNNMPNPAAMGTEVQFTGAGNVQAAFYGTGAGAISSYRRWLKVTPIWMT